jgi:hypothetical protein
MATVPFQPGKFQPLITIGVKPVEEPEALLPDFGGLERVTKRTAQLAYVKSSGQGGALGFDRRTIDGDSKIVAHTLAARNICEQLRVTSKLHTRFTSPLCNPTCELFEPVSKVYNYYGHVEVSDKKLSIQDGANALAKELVSLAKYATTARTTEASRVDHPGNLQDVDFRLLTVDPNGDLASTRRMPLEDRTIVFAQSFLQSNNLDKHAKRTLAQDMLNASTERGFVFVMRMAKERGYTNAEEQAVVTALPDPADDRHRDALRALFEDPNLSVADGETIPAKKVIAVVNRAYQCIRRFVTSLDFRMKTLTIPKYEGGSRAQLAWTDQSDVLYSEYELGADEVTVAYVMKTTSSAKLRYRVAPGDSPDLLLDQPCLPMY